jgi:hypothetical protein
LQSLAHFLCGRDEFKKDFVLTSEEKAAIDSQDFAFDEFAADYCGKLGLSFEEFKSQFQENLHKAAGHLVRVHFFCFNALLTNVFLAVQRKAPMESSKGKAGSKRFSYGRGLT